ncbi:MAG TPA: energy-coupling factor transporter ATPase [Firmicutes bacterium]|nr:energy-coupling factor transporter ATPase [Bacillota bacterium]
MHIKFKSVSHIYNHKTPMEQRAIYDINLDIKPNTFLAIVGHTGSGKSTLIQHMNGLLRPSIGEIHMGEHEIIADQRNKNLKAVRQAVGLVFQFPEYQLFEETVEKDIMFGPMNYGVSEDEAKQRARDVIKIVGLPDSILEQSPFHLSGGQMRRVAIAGILAMNPDVLVLDEPTAGLDPQGQKEMMGIFKDLHETHQKTIILVTHDMDLVCQYAQEVIVMHRGELKLSGTPHAVFKEVETLNECGITLPLPARSYLQFIQAQNLNETDLPLTTAEFIEKVKMLKGVSV